MSKHPHAKFFLPISEQETLAQQFLDLNQTSAKVYGHALILAVSKRYSLRSDMIAIFTHGTVSKGTKYAHQSINHINNSLNSFLRRLLVFGDY